MCLILSAEELKELLVDKKCLVFDLGTQNRVASLQNASNFQHLCGATLISPQIAVTAAHCVEHEPENYRLHLKNFCINDGIVTPSTQVLDIIPHPLFDRFSRAHDIALLRVQLELDDITWLKDTVIPHSSFGISGECTIYGYGYTNTETKKLSNKLLSAQLTLVSLDDCTESLGQFVAPKYDSGLICAVGDGVDACQGDSGAPLMCAGKLEGVSSYGLSCGVPRIPGVYTSIGAHLQWLRSIVEDIQS
ncbi:trypsin-2-like [Melitaea cinxia]|uniref:trypsin-2-like n=1 Tax=Melitaea cinxia TaxID=113334 RepID=UPI001E2735B5|nr:trypsin-2-like [Melitaea cinxia]